MTRRDAAIHIRYNDAPTSLYSRLPHSGSLSWSLSRDQFANDIFPMFLYQFLLLGVMLLSFYNRNTEHNSGFSLYKTKRVHSGDIEPGTPAWRVALLLLRSF